jgi:hypothetical protein
MESQMFSAKHQSKNAQQENQDQDENNMWADVTQKEEHRKLLLRRIFRKTELDRIAWLLTDPQWTMSGNETLQ